MHAFNLHIVVLEIEAGFRDAMAVSCHWAVFPAGSELLYFFLVHMTTSFPTGTTVTWTTEAYNPNASDTFLFSLQSLFFINSTTVVVI